MLRFKPIAYGLVGSLGGYFIGDYLGARKPPACGSAEALKALNSVKSRHILRALIYEQDARFTRYIEQEVWHETIRWNHAASADRKVVPKSMKWQWVNHAARRYTWDLKDIDFDRDRLLSIDPRQPSFDAIARKCGAFAEAAKERICFFL